MKKLSSKLQELINGELESFTNNMNERHTSQTIANGLSKEGAIPEGIQNIVSDHRKKMIVLENAKHAIEKIEKERVIVPDDKSNE